MEKQNHGEITGHPHAGCASFAFRVRKQPILEDAGRYRKSSKGNRGAAGEEKHRSDHQCGWRRVADHRCASERL
ncbi:MAG: heparinase II/III family protein [Lachnospiraceae bacterium]|nr:heparinase II/III family protein [Lachnospiraceae bacterium]